MILNFKTPSIVLLDRWRHLILSYYHWNWRWSLPVMSCGVFFVYLTNWISLLYFQRWKVMLVGTVIWSVCVIMKLFILDHNWLLVASSDCRNRTQLLVYEVLIKIQRNRQKGSVFLLVLLNNLMIFLNLMNCWEIIHCEILVMDVLFVSFSIMWTAFVFIAMIFPFKLLSLKYFLGGMII